MNKIVFCGSNGSQVKAWVNEIAAASEGRESTATWFLTRGMSASTGNQAWRYVSHDRGWDTDVVAAVHDARRGWLPVRRGDTIVHGDDGFSVVVADEGSR